MHLYQRHSLLYKVFRGWRASINYRTSELVWIELLSLVGTRLRTPRQQGIARTKIHTRILVKKQLTSAAGEAH